MSTPVQDRVRTRFDLLDTDANGYLEAEDFDRLTDKIAAGLCVGADSAKARALRNGYRRYWQGLISTLDRDQDGRVSYEEFAQAVHDRDWYEQYARPFAVALAALADLDDDGQIERSEFVACLHAAGFPDERSEAVFGELDTAGRGHISPGDFEGMIRDYYVSESGAVPAQRLASA